MQNNGVTNSNCYSPVLHFEAGHHNNLFHEQLLETMYYKHYFYTIPEGSLSNTG